MRNLLGCLLLLFLGSCTASLYNTQYLHGVCGAPIHWQDNDFPIQIYVAEDLPPERQGALQSAVLHWNEAAGLTVFTVVGYSTTARQGRIIVQSYDLPDDLPSMEDDEWTVGLTRNVTSNELTGHIEYSIVSIDYKTPDWQAEIVFAHELGHALGLAHDMSTSSVMYRRASQSAGYIEPDDITFVRLQASIGWSAYSP